MEQEEVYEKRGGVMGDMGNGEKRKEREGVKVKVANLVSCCIAPSDSW